MNWPFPSEGQDPWFDAFQGLVNALDASSFAHRENDPVVLMEGGLVSWDASTGVLDWAGTIEINASITGFRWNLPTDSINLQEGQLLYVEITRSPTDNKTVTSQISTQLPSTDTTLFLALRRNNRIYWRNGKVLNDGDSINVFEVSGGGGGGEVNTGVNVGAGTGLLFRNKVGLNLNFRSLIGGTNTTVTNNADDITIDSTGEANTGVNVGAGTGNVFRDKTGVDLNLKTLIGGTNVNVTDNVDDITIDATGEANTGANVGAGSGQVFRDKTGTTINLKTLIGGTNVTVTNNADDITIDATGGGGGSGLTPLAINEQTPDVPYTVIGSFEVDGSANPTPDFVVVANVSGAGLNGDVQLFNFTDSAAEVTINFTETTPTQKTAVTSLPIGIKLYEVRVRLNNGVGPSDLLFARWAGLDLS
jgi:hypothetical protein